MYLPLFYVHGCFIYVRVLDLGVIYTCELSCGCWDLNMGPLEVPLTAVPCLQPLQPFCVCVCVTVYVCVCLCVCVKNNKIKIKSMVCNI